ncbi:MAG: hypothetical protein ACYDB1_09590 [Acidiferrobacteraceae bacterium]
MTDTINSLSEFLSLAGGAATIGLFFGFLYTTGTILAKRLFKG